MNLLSISLIAAALAVIAGGTTAAPAPRPFERDVDIYSRTNGQAPNVPGAHHDQAASIEPVGHAKAAELNQRAAKLAGEMGWHDLAARHKDIAGLNLGYVQKGKHNPSYADSSIKIAHKTISMAKPKDAPTRKRRRHSESDMTQANCDKRVKHGTHDPLLAKHLTEMAEHAEAATLNEQAAGNAKEMGWEEAAKEHKDIAEQNRKQVRVGQYHPEFAQVSKEAAHETFKAYARKPK